MLIHYMSAQNIEREWIGLTCTWLVVDGGEVNRFSGIASLVNRANIRFLITHKSRGSIVAFLINKSVEPNEEQKVLISDTG